MPATQADSIGYLRSDISICPCEKKLSERLFLNLDWFKVSRDYMLNIIKNLFEFISKPFPLSKTDQLVTLSPPFHIMLMYNLFGRTCYTFRWQNFLSLFVYIWKLLCKDKSSIFKMISSFITLSIYNLWCICVCLLITVSANVLCFVSTLLLLVLMYLYNRLFKW